MKQMENDFDRLDSPEPYAHAHERLNVAVENIFRQTQALVPEGTGDKRRPAGALRDSGRVHTESVGSDYWSAEIAYGYEGQDPIVNYARWTWRKMLDREGRTYMDPTDSIARAMSEAFLDVFGRGQ